MVVLGELAVPNTPGEEIVENANAVTEALGGDEGAAAIIASVRPRLAAVARHLPQAEAWLV